MKSLYRRTAMNDRYGGHLSKHNIRRVWAAISETPHASRQELAETLELSKGAITSALLLLKDAGYIRFPKHASRAIEIDFPLYVGEFGIGGGGE